MLAEIITGVAVTAFVYHHAVFPALLHWVGRQRGPVAPSATVAEANLPSVTLIVPVHNEAAVIEEKLVNIGQIDYPRALLRIVIACDGCTDATVEIARRAATAHAGNMNVDIIEYQTNIGKVAILNNQIARARTDIIALSDTSAMFEADALRRAVAHFSDPKIGVVCPTYRLSRAGSDGEGAYWDYQTKIKVGEAHLGAPMGAHGALYFFRRSLWHPLPPDTINDDFVLPMRMVAAGALAVYDDRIIVTEREVTGRKQEFNRRLRIGAGNMQQILWLKELANPRRPGLALTFLSGKGLRPIIPFLVLAAFAAILVEAACGSRMFQVLALLATFGSGLVAYGSSRRGKGSRLLGLLGYLVEGHAASLLGALRYLIGMESKPWARASAVDASIVPTGDVYMPTAVAISKRIVDIICAVGAFAVLVLAFVPVGLAIKLTSRGPIFYRQLRVGRTTPEATHLFYLIKFRTMRVDAESISGAVWASKNDPRITPIGRFLRKTRLDELPQAINVLKGEMSVIGPRPERPSFFTKLEDAIPFYSERTYGLRPGITGLAQVNQPYDQCIEDVRNKVLYDHAYAAQLIRWSDWLRTDISIIFKTAVVMGLGKGQ